MKVSPLFVLREIADEYLVIPIGEEAEKIQGFLSLNSEGAFLWKLLENDQTEESLIEAMKNNYNVEERIARDDISIFLNDLRKIGCLI